MMKDPMQYLDELASSAREEMAPQGDVVVSVLRQIRRARPSLAKPMLVFASSYAAATAVLAITYGAMVLDSVRDPLSAVFQMAAGMSL